MEYRLLRQETIRSEEEAIEIFEFWNSLELVKHKNKGMLYDKCVRMLTRLEIDKDTIKKSMINYKEIVESDYFFNYIFNLDRFISGKVKEFEDEGHQWKNYLLFKESKTKDEKDVQNGKLVVTGYSEMLEYFNSMPYKEYLLTAHWKHFSGQAIRFFGKCVVCDTTSNLKIHHKNYKNRGRETFLDVICLCNNCHAKFHNKFKQ